MKHYKSYLKIMVFICTLISLICITYFYANYKNISKCNDFPIYVQISANSGNGDTYIQDGIFLKNIGSATSSSGKVDVFLPYNSSKYTSKIKECVKEDNTVSTI
jgi:hypothetical protein